MLKRGITSVQGLARPHTVFGRPRHASLLLFAELAARPDGDAAADRLVARVRLPNGTWKLTGSGRLADVDALLCAQIRATLGGGTPLTVLDLGASTGVTSVALFDCLSREHADLTFIASDLYRDALAVRGRGWTVVLTLAGEPLQYVVGPFVLPAQLAESPLYAGNRALKRLAERRLLPRARTAIAALASEPPADGTVPVDGLQVSRFSLLAAGCRERLRDPRFRFEVIDVLQPIAWRATVVRALNVVTADNFDALGLRRALRHCIDAVAPGGLLVLGRTALGGGETRATCYRRTGTGLVPLARLRGGCELEGLTCRLAAGRAAAERGAALAASAPA